MPIQSPFFPRTSELCTSMFWKDWAGYYAVRSYDTTHDREYFAIRHGVALIDVTPLFKYDVHGKDAAAFLSRMMVKDIRKLKPGQVTYLCWCDDFGKVVDDGTVTRLDENHFRVTAAEPSLAWMARLAQRFDVTLTDITNKMAALSVQGPNSRELLKKVCDANMDSLRFFRSTQARFEGFEGTISRTGYTGDLGYEIWIENAYAVQLWDALYREGRAFGTEACGLDAMDVSRIEAGFVMNGVDYYSANHALIESRKSTPFELGLDWTVNLDRGPFIGQEALKLEKLSGPKKHLVCLDIDWPELESLYAEIGLPPQVCTQAWRSPVPLYDHSKNQIGYANCGAWSPLLKKNLALASVESGFEVIGTKMKIEVTVEYRRKTCTATVCPTPMFNPERKRFTPHA